VLLLRVRIGLFVSYRDDTQSKIQRLSYHSCSSRLRGPQSERIQKAAWPEKFTGAKEPSRTDVQNECTEGAVTGRIDHFVTGTGAKGSFSPKRGQWCDFSGRASISMLGRYKAEKKERPREMAGAYQ
jgi:hypothetical protein